MATQTLPRVAGRRQSRTTVAAVAAVFIGITITLVVALVIALAPTPARLSTQDALGPMDDYYFRHLPAPAVLGPNDDFGTRHGSPGR